MKRNMHSALAVVSVALLLVSYSHAGRNEGCISGVCGSRGRFSRDVVTSCAFASCANPSLVFSPTISSNSRSTKKVCSSRAFLPSVSRTQPPAIRTASAGLTGRAATSTSSIEPRSENEETVMEQQQQQSSPKEPNERLVIIIGGSGFLGTEIRKQLQDRGIQYIATTTPSTFRKMGEKDKFVPLDLTAENAQQDFYDIVSSAVKGDGTTPAKEVAVIAAMGTIGTKDDEKVNSALAEAIKGAHRVNVNDDDLVKSFVMIGNTERVRRLARQVSFLKGYAEGKDEAEATLQELFGQNACIIKVRWYLCLVFVESVDFIEPAISSNNSHLYCVVPLL